MRCPGCKSGRLAAAGEDFPVGTCPSCLGRWVPSTRLLRVEDEFRPLRPGDLGPGSAEFRCPACGSPFAAVDVGGVEVNVCTKCGGRWFDVGEEASAAKYPDPEPYGPED